jgi:hypothetical protein
MKSMETNEPQSPKLKYIPNIEVSVKGIRPYFGKYDYNFEGTNDKDDFYYFCEKSK